MIKTRQVHAAAPMAIIIIISTLAECPSWLDRRELGHCQARSSARSARCLDLELGADAHHWLPSNRMQLSRPALVVVVAASQVS